MWLQSCPSPVFGNLMRLQCCLSPGSLDDVAQLTPAPVRAFGSTSEERRSVAAGFIHDCRVAQAWVSFVVIGELPPNPHMPFSGMGVVHLVEALCWGRVPTELPDSLLSEGEQKTLGY